MIPREPYTPTFYNRSLTYVEIFLVDVYLLKQVEVNPTLDLFE